MVLQYDSHPIVNDLTNISTAFPLSRSLETKNTDKTTITKLFSTSADSYATNNLASSEIRIDPAKDKHGPFTLAVAGTYSTAANPAIRVALSWSETPAGPPIRRSDLAAIAICC